MALIRSEFPADEAGLELARQQGRLRVYQADFADWDSLRRGIEAVKAGEAKLDLLFNNAGVAFWDLRRVAADLDGHFALNIVVPYILLEELGLLLEAGTLKTVVQTSSNVLLYLRGFSVVSACPGGTRTKMMAEPQLWFMKVLFPLLSHPVAEGARRILQAATVAREPGSFLVGPRGRVAKPGFVDLAPQVLARVREIYERDDRKAPRG